MGATTVGRLVVRSPNRSPNIVVDFDNRGCNVPVLRNSGKHPARRFDGHTVNPSWRGQSDPVRVGGKLSHF